jgi:hypothetical protein
MSDQEILDRAERAVVRVELPHDRYEDLLRRRDRKHRKQRILAGSVGIAVFVVAIAVVTSIGSLDRTGGPAATGANHTRPAVTAPTFDLSGLPPEGAEPSSPAKGELVAGVQQLHVGGPSCTPMGE